MAKFQNWVNMNYLKQADEEGLDELETTAQQLAALVLLQQLFCQDVEQLAESLIAGEITLAVWQQRMKDLIKELLVSSIVIARGGDWDAVTDDDWAAVEEEIERQYQYLAGFAEDIYDKSEAGEEFTSAIIARAMLYAGVALAIFYWGIIAEAIEEERREVLWVVNPALENCSECLELQGMGWMSMGEFRALDQVPGDGQRLCGPKCGCGLNLR